eukprot:2941560-Pleurochrysis_carterae.AAC.6
MSSTRYERRVGVETNVRVECKQTGEKAEAAEALKFLFGSNVNRCLNQKNEIVGDDREDNSCVPRAVRTYGRRPCS